MPRRSDCPRMRRTDMESFVEHLIECAIDADGKRSMYSDTLPDEDASRERRHRRDNARAVLVIYTEDYLNDL